MAGLQSHYRWDFLALTEFIIRIILMVKWYSINICLQLSLIIDSVFQLKNAFDNLFEDLMQSEDGEKQAAEVRIRLVHPSLFFVQISYVIRVLSNI